jgi:hypothetical protein
VNKNLDPAAASAAASALLSRREEFLTENRACRTPLPVGLVAPAADRSDCLQVNRSVLVLPAASAEDPPDPSAAAAASVASRGIT